MKVGDRPLTLIANYALHVPGIEAFFLLLSPWGIFGSVDLWPLYVAQFSFRYVRIVLILIGNLLFFGVAGFGNDPCQRFNQLFVSILAHKDPISSDQTIGLSADSLVYLSCIFFFEIAMVTQTIDKGAPLWRSSCGGCSWLSMPPIDVSVND